jgi:hypothetical protein
MEVVKHNKLFIIEDKETGKTYKMRIEDHGWTFSTIRLYEIVKYTRPRFYFFGDSIEDTKQVLITRSHRSDNLCPVVEKRPYYSKEKVKEILRDLLKDLSKDDELKIVNQIEI